MLGRLFRSFLVKTRMFRRRDPQSVQTIRGPHTTAFSRVKQTQTLRAAYIAVPWSACRERGTRNPFRRLRAPRLAGHPMEEQVAQPVERERESFLTSKSAAPLPRRGPRGGGGAARPDPGDTPGAPIVVQKLEGCLFSTNELYVDMNSFGGADKASIHWKGLT